MGGLTEFASQSHRELLATGDVGGEDQHTVGDVLRAQPCRAAPSLQHFLRAIGNFAAWRMGWLDSTQADFGERRPKRSSPQE